MDILTIMESIAKIFKNKGYRMKVDKKCYLLFEKEEDYEI